MFQAIPIPLIALLFSNHRGLGLCALVPNLMRLRGRVGSSALMLCSAPGFLEKFLVIGARSDQRIQVDDYSYIGGVGVAIISTNFIEGRRSLAPASSDRATNRHIYHPTLQILGVASSTNNCTSGTIPGFSNNCHSVKVKANTDRGPRRRAHSQTI